MADYAGETLELYTTGTDLDASTPLTPDNTTSVTLDVRTAAGDAVLTGEVMAWNVEESLWYLRWDTGGLDPGRYIARVTYLGTDGSTSIEFLSVRLSKPKFTT